MLDQIINKINKQDYENAQKDLKKIITTDSSNSKAFYLLGIINLKINNIEEAIEYFQKALALNQSIEYLFAYSEALIKNNLFDPPMLFKLIQKESNTSWDEMYKVFNCGHRMELYVDQEIAQQIINISKRFNVEARIIGKVEKSASKKLTIKSQFGDFQY